jgi:hypothetical protein
MAEAQAFTSWTIIDSGLRRVSNGFNWWETKALAQDLMRRGEAVRILTHRDAPPPDAFAGAEIVPTFALSTYDTVSADPQWSMIENFVVHNRAYHENLARIDAATFRGALAWFPMVTPAQLLGLLRWVAGLPAEMRPKAAINLFEPGGEWSGNQTVKFYCTIWRGFRPDVKRDVVLFARTRIAAEKFTKEFGVPVTIFPRALPERFLEATRPAVEADGPMVVSFVGGARLERGCALIPEVVKRCAGTGVEFFIQVRSGLERGVDARALTALAALPHVRVVQGALDYEAYYRAIGSSVVLLPYQPNEYRWRDSGVYHEAKLLDAPVLVTSGTWMADDVRALGNGLVIENFSVDAVIDAIARAQRERSSLRAAAARAGREARKSEGVTRCIEAVAGAFGA